VIKAAGKGPTDPVSEATVLSLPPADTVTALRVIGTGVELPFPRPGDQRFTIGAAAYPAVDLSLHAPTVSRLHAEVVVDGNKVRVVDAGSTNGIFLHDRREREFQVTAGQVFRIADLLVIALDDALRSLRPALAAGLGFDAHAAVDGALTAAAEGGPLLMLGRAGCDQARIARAVHVASARRRMPFVEIGELEGRAAEKTALLQASKGTAYIDLRATRRMTAFVVSELFGTTYHIRPIFTAPDRSRVDRELGSYATQLRSFMVPTLAERAHDIPALFNQIFETELRTARRVEELGAANVQALTQRAWADNIDGLRRVAPKLLARMEAGSVLGAAKRLGIRHQSLHETFDALGLQFRK
jgi:hypothetical protein